MIVESTKGGAELGCMGEPQEEPEGMICTINVKHGFFQVFGEPSDPIVALHKTLAVARYTTEAVKNKTAKAMMEYFNEYIKKTKI